MCYTIVMGVLGPIISKLFPKSFPQHDFVKALNFSEYPPEEKAVLENITDNLKANKPFELKFKRQDNTRIAVSFTGTKLNIDAFNPDGTRNEFKSKYLYMGASQWGGGIHSYKADGSFDGEHSGVYPRKFNSALDIFNYTFRDLLKASPNAEVKGHDENTVQELHRALEEPDLKLIEALVQSGQVVNPKEIAQEGELTRMRTESGQEFILKRLTNGRLLEFESKKIFLRNNNVHHFKLIEALDEMQDRACQQYGTPSELGELIGIKGMLGFKAQPVFEADGVTLVKSEEPKLLKPAPVTNSNVTDPAILAV